MNQSAVTIENSCSRELIAAYVDGELSPGEELALDLHLAGCKICLAELNAQKQLLCALDFGFDDKKEIELPENFAHVVAARAASDVSGLRSGRERFRAVFLCASLLLIILFGLGAETNGALAIAGKFGEQSLAFAAFAGHFVYDLAIGAIVILRSLGGRFVFDSAGSSALSALLFAASMLLLTRLVRRRSQT